LAAAGVLMLSSCGKASAASKTPSVITVNLASEPETLDPQISSTVDSEIYIMHAFEGLYKFVDSGKSFSPASADCAGLDGAKTVPGLAKAPPRKTVNPDGTVTLTYTLRDNLKWSDGSPLTAGDFVYSWRRLVDPKTGSDYSYMIEMVKNATDIEAGKKDPSTLGISAPDNKTVVITLINDCPYFDQIAAFPSAYPVKQAAIEAKGDKWIYDPKRYVCSGPYRMTKWEHNSYILFEKNPFYYNAANVKGPQYIKWALMDNDNAIFAAYKSGDIDFIQYFPVDEVPALIKDGTLKMFDYPGTYYVDFNNEKPPFNDIRVREAFSLAIDRNFIVNQVTRQGQKPANAYVPGGMSDATPGSDFRANGNTYYSVKPADYAANCKKAQDLMAQAGFPGGKGFPVVEYNYNTNDQHRAIGEALQNMWKTVLGVNVELTNMDWAVFLSNRRQHNYSGMARDGWTADYDDPTSFLNLFVTGDGNNFSYYTNSQYDSLMKQVQTGTDNTVRMKEMHQAEDLMMNNWTVAPLYFYTQLYALNSRVKGAYCSGLAFFFFDEATLTK
jgi:oligopeptide transport system substrate-binding protein